LIRNAYLFDFQNLGGAGTIFEQNFIAWFDSSAKIFVSCGDQLLIAFSGLVDVDEQGLFSFQLNRFLIFVLADLDLDTCCIQHHRACLPWPLLKGIF